MECLPIESICLGYQHLNYETLTFLVVFPTVIVECNIKVRYGTQCQVKYQIIELGSEEMCVSNV